MVFWPRCPKQGIQFDLPLSQTSLKPVLNRVWYYEPRDLNPDCEQQRVSFLDLHNINLVNRPLPGHYNVINQHQIIFWTRILLLSVS